MTRNLSWPAVSLQKRKNKSGLLIGKWRHRWVIFSNLNSTNERVFFSFPMQIEIRTRRETKRQRTKSELYIDNHRSSTFELWNRRRWSERMSFEMFRRQNVSLNYSKQKKTSSIDDRAAPLNELCRRSILRWWEFWNEKLHQILPWLKENERLFSHGPHDKSTTEQRWIFAFEFERFAKLPSFFTSSRADIR